MSSPTSWPMICSPPCTKRSVAAATTQPAGAIGGPIVDLDVRTLYLNDLTMHGCTVLPPVVFANLVRYIENGEIRPIVAASFPLQNLWAAQEAFMKKDHVGAIVIEVA